MKKNRGSALVDYVIPTAVIGIILGLSLYYMMSNGTLLNYLAASANMKVDMNTGQGVIGPNLSNSSTDTGTDGIFTCASGKCDIDFGDFILTGIPENFGELVKTTGTSGGTDELMSLIEQIADQLADKGDADGAAEYRKLANLGHFIADVQKSNESAINACSTKVAYEIYSCLQDTAAQSANIPLPPDLADILTGYSQDDSLGLISQRTEIGKARNEMDLTSNVSPGAAFIVYYDKIMANTKYSDNMKNITKELYKNIADLTDTHSLTVQVSNGFANFVLPDKPQEAYDNFTTFFDKVRYDPLTGEASNYRVFWDGTKYKNILHPETSVGTDLNSAFICATGLNKDTGTECKK